MHFTGYLLPVLLAVVPCITAQDAEFKAYNDEMDKIYNKYNGHDTPDLFRRVRLFNNYGNPTWVTQNILKIVDKYQFVSDTTKIAHKIETTDEDADAMLKDLADAGIPLAAAESFRAPENERKLAEMKETHDKWIQVARDAKRIIPTFTNEWFTGKTNIAQPPWTAKQYFAEKTKQNLDNKMWFKWAVDKSDLWHKYHWPAFRTAGEFDDTKYKGWDSPEEEAEARQKAMFLVVKSVPYLIFHTIHTVFPIFDNIIKKNLEDYLFNVQRFAEHRHVEVEGIISKITHRYNTNRYQYWSRPIDKDVKIGIEKFLLGAGKNKRHGVNEMLKEWFTQGRKIITPVKEPKPSPDGDEEGPNIDESPVGYSEPDWEGGNDY